MRQPRRGGFCLLAWSLALGRIEPKGIFLCAELWALRQQPCEHRFVLTLKEWGKIADLVRVPMIAVRAITPMATLRVEYFAGNKGKNADRIDDARRSLKLVN
jgi:hypothetical protein